MEAVCSVWILESSSDPEAQDPSFSSTSCPIRIPRSPNCLAPFILSMAVRLLGLVVDGDNLSRF
jgi:hypothetical protein